jgi:hypothetical protein
MCSVFEERKVPIVVVFMAGCDMNKVDPGGGASTLTQVTARSSIGTTVVDGGAVLTPDPPSEESGPGGLVGIIKFEGAKPVLSPVAAQGQPKDPSVCAKDAAIPGESILVSDSGGLKNVFVYLKKKPRSWKGKFEPKETLIFDQKSCIFTSHALIVAAGTKFSVKNSDAIPHNVNTGGMKKNPKDNFGVAANSAVEYSLKRAENMPARVNCDIHSWMDAYLLPLDHPFGAVTDDEGNFTIPDVPSGDYEIRIWHQQSKEPYLDSVKIKVTVGDPTRLDKAFSSSEFKIIP